MSDYSDFTPTSSKFGVPLGDDSGRGGLLSPKLAYRFRVRMVHFGPLTGGTEFTQQVMNCSMPSISYAPIKLDSYNSVAYVAGKHAWAPITITLRDDITNSIQTLVGYQEQKQLNNLEQTGFASGINYKFTTIIEKMDGSNDGVLQTYVLEGCWLTSSSESGLDFANSAVNTITLNIQYDNCTNVGMFPDAPEYVSGDVVF